MTDLQSIAREMFAESLAYRALELALQKMIKDPNTKDDEIELADGFLCTMRETKKKCLEALKKREAKR